MIKTFEQFVSDRYGKPINEGFRSSVLREIIKQHGLPKEKLDKKMLYDLKDNEIIDVVSSREEYFEKYDKPRKVNEDEAAFMIELEDGYCIVISNLGILKKYFQSNRDMINAIKPKHTERHKGNQGKNYADDHAIHLSNVGKLELKRFIAKLQPYLPEIIEVIQSKLEKVDVSTFEGLSQSIGTSGTEEFEFEINLDDNEYKICGEYSYKGFNWEHRKGAEYYDVEYNLDWFGIEDENENFANNDDLGISPETNKNLFKQYTIYDIEGGIYDYYDYYGVSPKDFM